jgi:hypothetical protein
MVFLCINVLCTVGGLRLQGVLGLGLIMVQLYCDLASQGMRFRAV